MSEVVILHFCLGFYGACLTLPLAISPVRAGSMALCIAFGSQVYTLCSRYSVYTEGQINVVVHHPATKHVLHLFSSSVDPKEPLECSVCYGAVINWGSIVTQGILPKATAPPTVVAERSGFLLEYQAAESCGLDHVRVY